MATNIGMMDSAYFVGRSEILAWINSTLHLNLSKVEEVSPETPIALLLLFVFFLSFFWKFCLCDPYYGFLNCRHALVRFIAN